MFNKLNTISLHLKRIHMKCCVIISINLFPKYTAPMDDSFFFIRTISRREMRISCCNFSEYFRGLINSILADFFDTKSEIGIYRVYIEDVDHYCDDVIHHCQIVQVAGVYHEIFQILVRPLYE